LILNNIKMNSTLDTLKAIKPEIYHFDDDGNIPNSKYPLLVYRHTLSETGIKAAEWLERQFSLNNWTNSWRWGVYSYHHYHSNTHEVLGVYSGNAVLQMGGENGIKMNVEAGDVIIIPAGVAHKNINCSDDFSVVGAYPKGKEPDMKKGLEGERPQADENLAKVPIPDTDPLMGGTEGLVKIWRNSN
jgi:uncharacterized protein YjlB